MIVTNDKTVQMKSMSKNFFQNISKDIGDILKKIPPDVFGCIEEIRLKTNKPLMIYDGSTGWFVTEEGELTENMSVGYVVRQETINKTIELISNSSVYAIQEELKNGFVTIEGGHRVGVTGKVVIRNGNIISIKDIAGMNIRISKQIIGAADGVMKYITEGENKVYNTLITSPPQCGKTTMLRDIARQLSYGNINKGITGKKVGIVDERSEIAACFKGIPQNDVGPRTDVLDACPKAVGMIMMIRSMSPEVLITDEIGTNQDISALRHVLNAGVKIIASVHGYSREDVVKKPLFKNMLHDRLFEKMIVLGKSKGTGTVEQVWDEN